jgi:hypothetical protein
MKRLEALAARVLTTSEALSSTLSSVRIGDAAETVLLAVSGCFVSQGAVYLSLRTLRHACECAALLDQEPLWTVHATSILKEERWFRLRQFVRRMRTPCACHRGSHSRST